MPEQHCLPACEGSPTNQINQTAHRPTGVHGVEQNAFQLGHHLDRFPLRFADDGVAFAQVVVVDVDAGGQGERAQAEMGGRGRGQGGDLRLQFGGGMVDADADDLALKIVNGRA